MKPYPPETIWDMCKSKNTYPTYIAATKNLKALQALRRNRKKRLRCYSCPLCKKWHLTSR